MIPVKLPNGQIINTNAKTNEEATKAARKFVTSLPYLEKEYERQASQGEVDFSLRKQLDQKRNEEFSEKTGIPNFPSVFDVIPGGQFIEKTFSKAARDIGVGILTLPSDIAGYFDPKYEETSKSIEKTFPKVGGLNAKEDFVATALQYGLPGGAGAKTALNVVKNAPKAVKYGAAVLGAAAADVAVTPQDSAVTIGDYVGGPTDIKNTDPNILKRLKVGAETLPLAPATDLFLKGAIKGVKTISSPFKPFTAKGQKDIVGKTIAEQAGIYDPKTDTLDLINRDRVLKTIDENIDIAKTISVKPTLAAASQDIGLTALERGIATGGLNNRGRVLYTARSIDNIKNVNVELDKILDKRGTNFDGFSKFFRNETDKLEAVNLKTKQQLLESELELTNLIDDFAEAYPTTGGVQASLNLNNEVADVLLSVNTRKNQLFDAIDPNNQLLIDPIPLRRVVKDIKKPSSNLDFTPQELPTNILKKIETALKPDKKTKQVNFTFGALQDLRPKLSEAISNARKDGLGEVVKRLTKVKSVADGYVNKLAENSNIGVQAQKALDYYKNTYVPTFRESIGKQFRESINKGVPFNPSQTASKFLITKPGGQLEAATNLSKIIQESSTPFMATNSVKSYMGSELARQIVDTNGKAVPRKIKNFKQNYNEVLKLFPEVKKEIDLFEQSILTKTGKVTDIERSFINNKNKFNKNSIAYNLKEAELYINQNPVQAIDTVLQSKDPIKELNKLLKLVNKDPTGNALQGLKNGLKESVWQKITTNKVLPEGQVYDISRAYVEKLFKEKDAVLKKLFTKDEYQSLNNVRKTLNNLDILNYQVTTGSTTKELAADADKLRIVLASWYGIVKGRGVFAITKFAANILGITPAADLNKLLLDSMLDPQLGKQVIKQVTPKTERSIEEFLNSYILNNVLTTGLEPTNEQE